MEQLECITHWLPLDGFLQLVLALIMLGVGLSLRVADFDYLIKNRRLLLIGLGWKLLLIPFLTFCLLQFIPLRTDWKIGTLLLLFCPGGTTSNVITYWMKGTSALTIFLTVLSGLIVVFTLPVFLSLSTQFYLGTSENLALSFWDTALQVGRIILLPTLLGMILRTKLETFAQQLEDFLRPVAIGLLGLVYLLKFLTPTEDGQGLALTLTTIMQLLPWLLIINIGGMLLARAVSLYQGLSPRDSMTIGIEMGIQNVALAILIADVLLEQPTWSEPAFLYALFSFWTTLGFAYFSSKKSRPTSLF